MGRPRTEGDLYWKEYKDTERRFFPALKKLAKKYENDEIIQIVKSAEINRSSFWNHIRACRKGPSSKSLVIKREDGVVIDRLDEVLEVWRKHFSKLGTPKQSDSFDDDHYRTVSEFIEQYNKGNNCNDTFLQNPFSVEKLDAAIKSLNNGKAPGFDKIVSEHIKFAGKETRDFLCSLYKRIREIEYIPKCFRLGVQIQLFKGNDLSNLVTDNYRGITLLSTFYKLFEILLWNKMKRWWVDEGVVSELQGECKPGHACLHTAFLLQEMVAMSLENNNNCIVAFYDVAKAFDSVWIGGLFKQINDRGITGETWRLLHRNYVDFKCCVKVMNSFSEWYTLACGIHQGGYISLLKYIVFINSSAPVGYADDLAAACNNKYKMDRVMEIVHNHRRTWRYDFNARKSGVLVFGETRREHSENSRNRLFRLGHDKVGEKTNYDHVGVNVSISSGDTIGIGEP